MKEKILVYCAFVFACIIEICIFVTCLISPPWNKEENHPVKTYDCGLDVTFEYDDDTCQVDTIDKIDSHGNLMRVTSK